MFRYLDEQAYRYNYGEGSDADRFEIALGRTIGRRVTGRGLTTVRPEPDPAGYKMTMAWGKLRSFPMGPFLVQSAGFLFLRDHAVNVVFGNGKHSP